jgi:hypothetical protein
MMKKDEREVLTRKRIAEQLVWKVKSSILSSAIVCGAGALLLTLLCRAFMMGWEPKAPGVLAWLAVVPFLIGFVFSLVRSLLRLGMIRRGEFMVEEDVLLDVETDRLNRWSAFFSGDYSIWNRLLSGRVYSQDCYEHIFYFESGRRFVANAAAYRGTRLEAVADFSMAGDVFFLVVYQDASQKIVLLYSSKIYRYQEREQTPSPW